MDDASSQISSQLGNVDLGDLKEEEEEMQDEEQVKEMKEELMTDSDIDSNTFSEKVANYTNLNESTNTSLPDSEHINYTDKSFRQAMLTVDNEVLKNQITNFNDPPQGGELLNWADHVEDEDKKTMLNFIETPTSDDDEEVKEKKEAEGDEGMEEREEEVMIVGTVMAMPGTDLRTQPSIANIKKENLTKVGANH